jgi:hypothetical protein
LEAIVPDLLKYEHGVLGIDGATGKRHVIVSPIAVFLGDDPWRSNVCGHCGMVAHVNCWFCLHVRQQCVWQFGKQCTRKFGQNIINDMTTLHLNGTDGDKKTAKKLQRNTGDQSGLNRLLYLRFVDPTQHTHVKLLHTTLLRISRYMMTEVNKQLVENNRKTPPQRSAFSAWIDTTYQRDMPSTITASNLMEYSKSFVGREYKLLMEFRFYLFRTVLTCCVDDSEDPEPFEDNNRVIEHTSTAVDDIMTIQ